MLILINLLILLINIYSFINININIIILGVVKRNPLFFHSVSCKNNGFLFTTPNKYYTIKLRKTNCKSKCFLFCMLKIIN